MDIKFKPLPNSVPEGTQVGDEFDLVCTMELCENGMVKVCQMGDVKAEDKGKPAYRPDFKDDAKDIQATMMSGAS